MWWSFYRKKGFKTTTTNKSTDIRETHVNSMFQIDPCFLSVTETKKQSLNCDVCCLKLCVDVLFRSFIAGKVNFWTLYDPFSFQSLCLEDKVKKITVIGIIRPAQ